MPPKKSKASKKASRMSEEEDIQIDQIDIQYNPDIVSSLIEDLGQTLEAKCAQIQKDSDFLSTSIQQAFHLELIKLPTQVKQMSIKRFKEEFGYSLTAVTKGVMGKPVQAAKFSGNSRSSTRVFETPSHKAGFSKFASATPRNPREGEVLLSQNGSPLGEFTTVKKAPREGGALCDNNMPPPTPAVQLKSGEVIDMDSDIENLSVEAKAETLQKMQEVMQNMQSLMAKLSAPSAV
ncbi:hypothetical protein B484DRAFT_448657 [Ochromonadaceae sp. CCMP2298]|nr:hypothetical protein B484DRAFT_448657 [Ochromonadaceae sp. CCMP2298]